MPGTEDRTIVRDYPFAVPDRLDLHPLYAQLREQEPMVRVRMPYGEPTWLATRYADARAVLGDPRFSRAASVGRDEPRIGAHRVSTGLLVMDPPEHTRLRRLLAKAFTARRVEQMRPHITVIAGELVDALIQHGPPVDLVAHFATPLPVRVICDLLGVPVRDQSRFGEWLEAIVSTTTLPPDELRERVLQMYGYLIDLIAQRRAAPLDDLISELARARDEDNDRLSEEEMLSLAAGLLAAGHETTLTQLSNFAYVLLTNPAAMAQLRAGPELLESAVEELMRFVPLGAGASFARYATVDVEVGGVLVRAGESVVCSVSSAHRDPAAFADPDILDLAREHNPHLGFGHGVHHCLGAPLGRIELQVALETLLHRLPGLRLAVAEEDVVWKRGLLVRGPAGLPVSW